MNTSPWLCRQPSGVCSEGWSWVPIWCQKWRNRNMQSSCYVLLLNREIPRELHAWWVKTTVVYINVYNNGRGTISRVRSAWKKPWRNNQKSYWTIIKQIEDVYEIPHKQRQRFKSLGTIQINITTSRHLGRLTLHTKVTFVRHAYATSFHKATSLCEKPPFVNHLMGSKEFLRER